MKYKHYTLVDQIVSHALWVNNSEIYVLIYQSWINKWMEGSQQKPSLSQLEGES